MRCVVLGLFDTVDGVLGSILKVDIARISNVSRPIGLFITEATQKHRLRCAFSSRFSLQTISNQRYKESPNGCDIIRQLTTWLLSKEWLISCDQLSNYFISALRPTDTCHLESFFIFVEYIGLQWLSLLIVDFDISIPVLYLPCTP